MSVLIKGMKMPDNCESCAFESGFGFCLAKSDNFCGYTNYRKRPDWCPLVEVPEPHGRLIDGDEFVRIWQGAKICGSIKPLVDARPTVIEADGE